ncbi:MAG: MazG nucleotide pyrophosphohydrolase domain-containing protein [Desulfoprunum sp.]|nr:MazG nucleotide pyrophosphohydrolase domain-containing protein [Desulfoprunum sp.]
MYFSELLHTIKELLGKNGCPWDKRQTNESLQEHLTSEMDELIQAIQKNDHENMCEELGDLLYLILLLSEINGGNGLFTLDDVLQTVNRKLIRRHPHVFAEIAVKSDDELRAQWLAIKAKEKAENLN